MKIKLLILIWPTVFLGCQTIDQKPNQVTSRQVAQVEGNDVAEGFNNLNQFQRFGGEGRLVQVKFAIIDFQNASGMTVFLNPSSYQFHDEWFLMYLFNGKSLPGLNFPPILNLNAKNPAEMQMRLSSLNPLPNGLVNVNGRIVADQFYQLSRGADRKFGLGSLIYSTRSKKVFAFDMVFNDEPTQPELERMYKRLTSVVNIPDLQWLPRSKKQQDLADMLKNQTAWNGRIAKQEDFIIPGEIVVYSGAVAAGKLIYVEKGSYDPSLLSADQIVLLEELPDELPPTQGIITSVPQTELAHVNILARGRGTLNAFIADPSLFNNLKTRALQNQSVALKNNSRSLGIYELTQEELKRFHNYSPKPNIVIPPQDIAHLDYIYDLNTLKNNQAAEIIRKVGGKSAGMIQIMNTPGAIYPPNPLGLSVRAYREHLTPTIFPLVKKMLEDERFKTNAKVRYLALEGVKAFKKLYPTESQQSPYLDLINGGDASALGQIIKSSGVKEMIEKRDLDKSLTMTIQTKLEQVFPSLPRGQGIRCRSSADVEDIPGFVGAGLYDSYTGYVNPQTHSLTEEDKKKTIARAIKKTWASYWNYRAFEERTLSKIDHLSGSMGVMIHPNFPESTELANGVLTIAWEKLRWTNQKLYTVTLNTQHGETSVVRPDGSVSLPQMIKLSYTPENELKDQFFSSMSPNSDGVQVLSKEEAVQLAAQASQVLEQWLNSINTQLRPEWRNQYWILDMEFKAIPANWLKDFSTTGPKTFILKQARPLIRGQSITSELEALPIPRNLLSEATKIIRRSSETDRFHFSTIEVYKQDTPYDGAFNAEVSFDFKNKMGPLEKGTKLKLNHTDILNANHGFMHHGPWDLSFDTSPQIQAQYGMMSYAMYESGGYSMSFANSPFIDGKGKSIKTDYLLANREAWLSKLLCEKEDLNPASKKQKENIGIGIGIGIKPMLNIDGSDKICD